MSSGKKLTIEEMREIANSRGGRCLSARYIDARTKLKWICRRGHEWNAVPDSVKRGTWCGICVNIDKVEANKAQMGATRICTKCKKEKPITEFFRCYSDRPYPVHRHCRDCMLSDVKKWRDSPIGKQWKKIHGNDPYNESPEARVKHIAASKRWWEKHGKEYRKRYYHLHREEYAIQRKPGRKVFYQKHRERIIQKGMEYVRNNPIAKTKSNLRISLWVALRHYTKTGKVMSSKKYGIDYGAIIKKLGKHPEDGQKWHVDHIRPLASFNLNDPIQVKEAFSPDNLRWLSSTENISKGSKWQGKVYRRKGAK